MTATRVIPSPRPSHRVPFGTGRAVGELLKNGGKYLTYSPRSFEDLQVFLGNELQRLHELSDLAAFYGRLPESISTFLRLNGFEKKLSEIQLNTSNTEAFQKRFWRWFDAFLVMKYVHFARENYYADVEVTVVAGWLMGQMGLPLSDRNTKQMLELLRR